MKWLGLIGYYLVWPLLYIVVGGSERSRVVLHCGEDVLVIKNLLGNDKWSLPGGGLHKDEAFSEGAAREVKEETGIAVAEVELLKRQPLSDNGINFMCHYGRVRLFQKPPVRRQWYEVRAIAWLPQASLSHRNANPEVLAALRLSREMV